MMVVLTILCLITVIADGIMVARLAHLVSGIRYGCATATGCAFDRLETTAMLVAPLVVGCAVLAHLARSRLNRLFRWAAFLPWGIGSVLVATPLFLPMLMRLAR